MNETCMSLINNVRATYLPTYLSIYQYSTVQTASSQASIWYAASVCTLYTHLDQLIQVNHIYICKPY